MIKKKIEGIYQKKGYGVVSQKNIFKDEHPELGEVYPGTVNVNLNENICPLYENKIREKAKQRKPPIYYADGNHICPTIRILRVNEESLLGYLYRGGHPQANHIEMVFPRNIGSFLSSQLVLDVGILEQNDCSEMIEFIENNDPLGDDFWIKLHKISEDRFKYILRR